jgi:pimeloyl-ACP methyl ester carboxylesterase
VQWVLTCFPGSSDFLHVFDEIEQLQGIGMARSHTMRPEKLAAFLQKRFPRTTRITWVGHSWGGWLALKTTLALAALPAGTRPTVALLGTIDPISGAECRPKRMAETLWEYIFGHLTPRPECTRAPQDLAKWEGRWLNFYQTQARHLHSGPAGARDEFRVVIPGYPESTDSFGPHLEIDSRPEVWDQILRHLEP